MWHAAKQQTNKLWTLEKWNKTEEGFQNPKFKQERTSAGMGRAPRMLPARVWWLREIANKPFQAAVRGDVLGFFTEASRSVIHFPLFFFSSPLPTHWAANVSVSRKLSARRSWVGPWWPWHPAEPIGSLSGYWLRACPEVAHSVPPLKDSSQARGHTAQNSVSCSLHQAGWSHKKIEMKGMGKNI